MSEKTPLAGTATKYKKTGYTHNHHGVPPDKLIETPETEHIYSIVCTDTVAAEDWDQLATSMKGGLFHSYAYTLYESSLSHTIPLFIKILDGSQRCIGIAAGTLNIPRIWPFSHYCRVASFPSLPATESDNPFVIRMILTSLENYLRRTGVHEIQFASYDSPASAHTLPQLDYHITARNEYLFDLTDELDVIWKTMAPSRRNKIRKAEKYGVQTRLENCERSLQLVGNFHSLSMQRRGIASSPGSPHKIAAQLNLISSGHAYAFVSYRGDEALNADLIGYFAGKAYRLFSGSSDDGNKYCGPVHLIWTAISFFKELGASELNLGGARENEVSLRKFKQEFGAIEKAEPNGRKSISRTGTFLSKCRRLLP